jgi:preprotein translocase subunit YajC
MNQLFILLMAPPQEGQNPLMAFLPLLLIIVVFYFFMIRPQIKRQKELRNFRSQLKKGDKIITTGGIYGRIAEISDQHVIMEVEDKMRLKVDKNAVVKDPSDLTAQK